MNKHIELLGMKAKDRVTGFKGVITTVSFDLFGCIQVVIAPGVKKDGSTGNGGWYDVGRLEIKNAPRVMPLPDFELGHVAEGRKGPAEKPPMETRS